MTANSTEGEGGHAEVVHSVDASAGHQSPNQGHAASVALGQGLVDGFEHFLTPTDSEYETVLKSGTVSLDANVLLDFYRFAKATRSDLAQVLERLGDRVYITYQAASEFWSNREATLQSYDASLAAVKTQLQELIAKGEQAINQWANTVSLPSRQKRSVVESWNKSAQRIVDRLDSLGVEHSSAISFQTWEDEVLSQLAGLLHRNVGSRPRPDVAALRQAEANERIAQNRPPGYMDKHKGDGKGTGDYLIWAEMLEEGEKRRTDVLFVTRDSKKDWWHVPPRGRPIPRRELQVEFREGTGRRFYMLATSDFLRLAADVFDLRIKEESIQDVGRPARIARRSAGTGLRPIDKLGGGRPGETYTSIVTRMLELCQRPVAYEQLVNDYMRVFPTISLPGEARRRVDNLFVLGLAEVDEEVVKLTDAGQLLLETHDTDVLQRQFMTHILGAEEIVRAARDGTLPFLPDGLPSGVTDTQVGHVLRWASQLRLTDAEPNVSTGQVSSDAAATPER